ncbi:hypothetical protein KBB05_04155 [Patescibacteria group bacterium]|nr:hypothetical protein [Patescibacteria group bacterium]
MATIVWILMSSSIELPSLPKVSFHVPEKPSDSNAHHQIINNPTPIHRNAYKQLAEHQKSSQKD